MVYWMEILKTTAAAEAGFPVEGLVVSAASLCVHVLIFCLRFGEF
jgi:hypothetical protein